MGGLLSDITVSLALIELLCLRECRLCVHDPAWPPEV
jgi:hypothetical protein